jgi:hypothetical protein
VSAFAPSEAELEKRLQMAMFNSDSRTGLIFLEITLMEDITNQDILQANANAAPTTLSHYRANCFELMKPQSPNRDGRRFSTSTLRSLDKYYRSCIDDVDTISKVADEQTARTMLIWHRVCLSFMKTDF